LYILEYFGEDLKKLRLHEAFRATFFGIEISNPNFYTIFELYCPASGTSSIPSASWGWHYTR